MFLKRIINVKIIILMLVMFFWLLNTTNATDVWWYISTNTTWSLANSPYIVTSSITLSSWVKLTIEPGVEVRFNVWLYLIIYWELSAVWTSTEKIIFTSNSATPTTSDWGGIVFSWAWSNGSILDYIEQRYARSTYPPASYTYAWIYIYDSSVKISNSLIENNNDYGIFINSITNHPIIDNNIIQNNADGVYIYKWSPIITNNDVLNNTTNGIFMNYYSISPLIENNTIDWNWYSINIATWTPTIRWNNIRNWKYYWIYIYWASTLATIENNTIEDNKTWIYISWWDLVIENNIIQNNIEYWIYTTYLDIWWESKTPLSTVNTFSWNWIWNIVSSWFNILWTELTVDATQTDIVVVWTTALLSGKTLTIKPWSVIKWKSTWKVYIQWTLLAQWTWTWKIIFTSINDNSVWQAQWTWTPGVSDWQWLTIYWAWSNSSIMDYTEVRYWKNNTTKSYEYAWVYLYDSSVVISNSIIENNYDSWIFTYWTTNFPTFENNIIQNNSEGIFVYWWLPIIRNNNLLNNTQNWIRTFYYNTPIFATVENNIMEWNEYWVLIDYNSTALINNNEFKNNLENWIYISWNTSIVTNNLIENNLASWIKLGWWLPTIQDNIIQNNILYWIESILLDMWWEWDSISWNIFIWNIYEMATTWFAITDAELTIDWTKRDIVLVWNTSTSSTLLGSWKTLIIKPWSIIKLIWYWEVESQWKIIAQWTETEPIIFTSLNDNTVWQPLWSWTPWISDWSWIYLVWSWTNWSIFDNCEIRYWKKSISSPYSTYAIIYIYDSDVKITNSIIENGYDYWIFINWTTYYPTIENNIIQNNIDGWIYIYRGSPIIKNNDILNNNSKGINVAYYSESPLIENNIIIDNWYLWIQVSVWTPTVQYNLFYNNSTADASWITLDSTNITWLDPLFAVWGYELTFISPAINAWNPAYGLHPLSWDIYDIWAFEYSWYKSLSYIAWISWVWWRNLTYNWSFISDPTNWSDAPIINNETWSITSDGNISCSFLIKKLWTYSLKLQVWDWTELVGSVNRTFKIIQ